MLWASDPYPAGGIRRSARSFLTKTYHTMSMFRFIIIVVSLFCHLGFAEVPEAQAEAAFDLAKAAHAAHRALGAQSVSGTIRMKHDIDGYVREESDSFEAVFDGKLFFRHHFGPIRVGNGPSNLWRLETDSNRIWRPERKNGRLDYRIEDPLIGENPLLLMVLEPELKTSSPVLGTEMRILDPVELDGVKHDVLGFTQEFKRLTWFIHPETRFVRKIHIDFSQDILMKNRGVKQVPYAYFEIHYEQIKPIDAPTPDSFLPAVNEKTIEMPTRQP